MAELSDTITTPTINPARQGQEDHRQMRKREQNRQAQRNYRHNQKNKIKALEAAIAHSLCPLELPALATLTTPAPSTFTDTGEAFLTRGTMLALHEQQQPENGQTMWTSESICADDQPGIQALTDQTQSVLHIATSKENVSMVHLLLDRGADVNKQDCGGRTPLHLATERGLETMVRLFLQKMTDASADTNARQSPLSNTSTNGDEPLDSAALSRVAYPDMLS